MLNKEKAYVYELNPTDEFSPFKTEEELSLDDNTESDEDLMFDEGIKQEIKDTIKYAKELFTRYTCWEGDGEVYISGLPGDNCDTFPLIFVTIKQVINGCTFLYSPVELPYLEDYLAKKI